MCVCVCVRVRACPAYARSLACVPCRQKLYEEKKLLIERAEGSLDELANAYHHYGLLPTADGLICMPIILTFTLAAASEEQEKKTRHASKAVVSHGLFPDSGVYRTGGVSFREWAPNAENCCIVGEFNGWNPQAEHWCNKDEFGTFTLQLPALPDGSCPIPHASPVKVCFELAGGAKIYRLPAWARYCVKDGDKPQYTGSAGLS